MGRVDAIGRQMANVAALNSVEAASQPWVLLSFMGLNGDRPEWKFFDGWVRARLGHLEPVLARGDWLAGGFSVADILMADVLRPIDRFGGLAGFPACRAYLARATARPAFAKAHADQLAHFAAGDRDRAAGS